MRKLKKEEYDLIVFLLKDEPEVGRLVERLADRLVEEMDDGGMGSLRFLSEKSNRKFGREVAEISIMDKDNIPVSFAVFLDEDGDIYELDSFKGDFSPLKQFPRLPYNKL